MRTMTASWEVADKVVEVSYLKPGYYMVRHANIAVRETLFDLT